MECPMGGPVVSSTLPGQAVPGRLHSSFYVGVGIWTLVGCHIHIASTFTQWADSPVLPHVHSSLSWKVSLCGKLRLESLLECYPRACSFFQWVQPTCHIGNSVEKEGSLVVSQVGSRGGLKGNWLNNQDFLLLLFVFTYMSMYLLIYLCCACVWIPVCCHVHVEIKGQIRLFGSREWDSDLQSWLCLSSLSHFAGPILFSLGVMKLPNIDLGWWLHNYANVFKILNVPS